MTGGSIQLSEDLTEGNLFYRQHYENWILWRNSILFLLLLCSGIFVSIDLYNISDKKFNTFVWNNHPHFGRQHSQILNSLNIIKDLVTANNYITTEKVSSSISSVSSTSSLMNDQSGDNNNHNNEGKLNRTALKHHYSNNLFRRNVQLQHLTKSCLNMESIDWNMMLRRDKTYYRYESFIQLTNIDVKGSNFHFEDTNPLTNQISYTKEVTQRLDNLSFVLPFSSGISVHINVKNIRLLPEYEDVEHLASDNGIVMDSSRKSNMQHWRKPLETIIKTACRYPLPKQYYLAMHPYLDRHTTARRHVCKRNSQSPNICPANYPSGYVFYDRSINGQCTQNKASYLPPQLNSFYCTINSPLVNQLFQEEIIESQSYLKDIHCDTQRRICQTCLKQSCWNVEKNNINNNNNINVQSEMSVRQNLQNDVIGSHGDIGINNNNDVNNMNNNNHRVTSENLLQVNDIVQNLWAVNEPHCCRVDCYSSPSCLDYFGAKCEIYTSRHPNATEICLQGKTLKFTLNPEFDLNNGTYTCHIQHSPPKILYTIETWLTLDSSVSPNTIWYSSPLKYDINLENEKKYRSRKIDKLKDRIQNRQKLFQKRGALLLWNENIHLEHRTELPLWKDAIVHKSSDKALSLYKLKSFKEFDKEPPILQRHKEEKYIIVQFSKPFHYSTANWGNQTCQINISHIHRAQPIYAEDTKVPVKLTSGVQKTTSNTFLYTFQDRHRKSTIKVKTSKNHSLLYTAICLNGLTFKSSKHHAYTKQMTLNTHSKHSSEPIGRLNPNLRIYTKRLKTNCELNTTWRAIISGSVTRKPTYIHLKISTGFLKHTSPTHHLSSSTNEDTASRINEQKNILFEKDLILLPNVFNSTTVATNFEADEQSFEIHFDIEQIHFSSFNSILLHSSVLIFIHIKDCFTEYLLTKGFEILNNNDGLFKSTMVHAGQNNSMLKYYQSIRVDSLNTDKMHLPFIITCLIIGLTYIILLTIYAVVKICHSSNGVVRNASTNYTTVVSKVQRGGYSSFSVYPTNLLNANIQSSLTCSQKFFIMTYLCFRVFYTFLFTISVGLSFVLSIETDATVEFTSAVYNNHFVTMNTLGRYSGSFDSRLNSPSVMSTMPLATDIGNRWRGAKVWVLEAARMEDFAQSELLRQIQKGTGQVSDCGKHYEEHSKQLSKVMLYIGKQLISWLSQTNTPNSFTVKNSNNHMNGNPINYNYNFNNAIYEDPITMSISEKDKNGNNNHANGSAWTLNSMNVQISTIEQETWNNLERNSWLPYLDTVDDYLRKTRDDLDTKVIDYWAPYDQLLANLLINPWIAPARRALNTSWLQEKRISFMDRTYFGLLSNDIDSEDESQPSNDVSMLNGARETQSLMLSNFIGVPQPAHARLAGTRIWNSFRNLVPGLPSKFYYKLEPSSTLTSSSSSSTSSSSSLSLSSTIKASALNKDSDFQKKPKLYHDYRQMLSNEDWYHIPSGQLSLNDKQSIVDFTDFSTHFSVFSTAVTKKSGNLMSSDTNAYFLTLTQVRLLLLLLDAIIILARCFQTFNFMHNIWFGDTRLVSGNHSLHGMNENSQVMIESFDSSTIQQQQQHRQSQSLSLTQSQLQQQQQQQHSTSPNHPSNCHYQLQQNIRSPKRIPLPVGSTPFLHPTSCSSSLRESNHHTVSNEFSTSPTRNYNETMVVNQSIRINDCERKSSTGMNISQTSNPPTLHFDNGTGRFTACYCCLDTHYLLVITGIGLLFIGLVLLWATDRHVRPGWLLAKTGVFARSRALEDCRQRTNAILKTIQPNHINMDLIRSARINAAREAHWMNQLTNRLTHVQTHIQLQFITELCLLQKGLANHYYVLNQHQPQNQHQQAGQIHLPGTSDTKSSFSACELIGPNSQFTEQALSILSIWRLDPMTNKQIKHTLKTPTCHFSPIVPATYAESHLSRLLRMTSLNEHEYHPKKLKQKAKMSVSTNNQTDFTQTDGNQLDFDYEQITTSIGSLSTLINAVYRLMLTSLTVMIAMGGLLVCLHMISVLARMIIRIPVRKIYYASSYPPYTSSVNNQSYSPTPFRRRNSLSR